MEKDPSYIRGFKETRESTVDRTPKVALDFVPDQEQVCLRRFTARYDSGTQLRWP